MFMQHRYFHTEHLSLLCKQFKLYSSCSCIPNIAFLISSFINVFLAYENLLNAKITYSCLQTFPFGNLILQFGTRVKCGKTTPWKTVFEHLINNKIRNKGNVADSVIYEVAYIGRLRLFVLPVWKVILCRGLQTVVRQAFHILFPGGHSWHRGRCLFRRVG